MNNLRVQQYYLTRFISSNSLFSLSPKYSSAAYAEFACVLPLPVSIILRALIGGVWLSSGHATAPTLHAAMAAAIHAVVPACLVAVSAALGFVRKLAALGHTALKIGSKYSFTARKLACEPSPPSRRFLPCLAFARRLFRQRLESQVM
ncbi:MAG: hypothetical protein ACQEUM_05875 [Pseudomonadota bacterium]